MYAIAPARRDVVMPIELAETVLHFSIPALEEFGEARVEPSADIASAKSRVFGGEVLVSRLNPRKGRVVLVPTQLAEAAVASTEFVVLVPNPSRVERRYLAYALGEESFRQGLDAQVRSVTRSHQRVDPEVISQARIALPDLEEQRRIADFLDDQVTRIDNIIASRSEQLVLVELRRDTSIASRLASLGVPVPLGRLLLRSPSYGVLKPDAYDGPGSVPLLRIFNVSDDGGLVIQDLMRISPEQHREYGRTRLSAGDVLLSVVGTIGRVAIVSESLAGANISRAFARLTLRDPVAGPLLRWWLRSASFTEFVAVTTQGTAQAVLNMSDLVRFTVAIPDDRETLESVSADLADIEGQAKIALSALRVSIDLLMERKRALVTAAVTGQLDVSTPSRRAVGVIA